MERKELRGERAELTQEMNLRLQQGNAILGRKKYRRREENTIDV